MQYVSTRGEAPILGFDGVLRAGLASDGGLYVPQAWPQFSADKIRSLQGLSYVDLAVEVMMPFIGDAIPRPEFRAMVEQSYRRFSDYPDVTPLERMTDRLSLLDLTRGPTLAFKDVALQLLGQLFDHSLKQSGGVMNILGATSGDTGSAAIEGCRGRKAVNIFILFPEGRTSEIQRLQMTTVPDANVHALQVEGTFDDGQTIVKTLSNDAAFKRELNLTAVNSINWARIMAQVVYYFDAALKLGAPDKPVSFVVPSGNFGDAFAGYVAMQMGLPVNKLVLATNKNDILHRFVQTGTMQRRGIVPSPSPSMDIDISSNFERILFDYLDRDSRTVAAHMKSLSEEGQFSVAADVMTKMRRHIASGSATDAETRQAITHAFQNWNRLVDTHTGAGLWTALRLLNQGGIFGEEQIVCLKTAHPAKFPEDVEISTGKKPPLPEHMKDLYTRPERTLVLPNDANAVRAYLHKHALRPH